MARFAPTAHWRDSARPAKFFIWDSRSAFPLLLCLLHIRVWTFLLAIIAVCFFWVLEYYGFTIPIFVRWLRNFIAGPYKRATPWWKQ